MRSHVLDAIQHIAYTCARAGKLKETGDYDMTIAIRLVLASGLTSVDLLVLMKKAR